MRSNEMRAKYLSTNATCAWRDGRDACPTKASLQAFAIVRVPSQLLTRNSTFGNTEPTSEVLSQVQDAFLGTQHAQLCTIPANGGPRLAGQPGRELSDILWRRRLDRSARFPAQGARLAMDSQE